MLLRFSLSLSASLDSYTQQIVYQSSPNPDLSAPSPPIAHTTPRRCWLVVGLPVTASDKRLVCNTTPTGILRNFSLLVFFIFLPVIFYFLFFWFLFARTDWVLRLDKTLGNPPPSPAERLFRCPLQVLTNLPASFVPAYLRHTREHRGYLDNCLLPTSVTVTSLPVS